MTPRHVRTLRRSRSEPATVYLHIGTMKTGTSYLQRVLRRNAARLRKQGVRYPFDAAMGKAVRDVMSITARRGGTDGAWASLVADLHAWDGHSVVVSSELLSFASAEQVERVVGSLRPARVEIIVTARDLVRLLPSAWQNKVKHGRGWPFDKYVNAVISDPTKDTGPARSFWHHHDIVSIVSRWADCVGPDHVTVVTLPPSGSPPDLLWERFAAAVRVDPEGFDTTQDQKANLSLGYTEAELLRQVNDSLRDDVDQNDYHLHVRSYFSNIVLRPDADRTAVVDKPIVPAAAHDWTIVKSREMVEALRASGVRVVGDLEELVPAPLSPAQRAAAEAAVAPTIPEPVVRAVAQLLLRLIELDPPAKGKQVGKHKRDGEPEDDSIDDALEPGAFE